MIHHRWLQIYLVHQKLKFFLLGFQMDKYELEEGLQILAGKWSQGRNAEQKWWCKIKIGFYCRRFSYFDWLLQKYLIFSKLNHNHWYYLLHWLQIHITTLHHTDMTSIIFCTGEEHPTRARCMLQSKVLQVHVIGVLAHAGDYMLFFIVQDLPEPSSYVKLFTLIPIALWATSWRPKKLNLYTSTHYTF